MGGRGAGKTRAGACWVQHRVETGIMKLGCLIAPTMADIRDVLVEGPSGLLAVAPPWCRPEFFPSKRRVSWPNGARGLPERRKAQSHPRGERRHPVGRRFRLLAVSRIYHVRCAIDAGASRHTAAVFYQVRHNNGVGPPRVTVFGDYHALDVVSRKNAFAIKELANQLPCHGKIDCVRLDPAAAARTSLGPAAYAEYEQVFGSRLVARWPRHMVLDGLEMLDLLLESGNLLIHPRCMRLRDAFQTYARQRRGGEWIDYPADGHPEEDMIDALRGGVRDAFPRAWCHGPTSARSTLGGSWDEPARATGISPSTREHASSHRSSHPLRAAEPGRQGVNHSRPVRESVAPPDRT